jgi:hypothetical protein
MNVPRTGYRHQDFALEHSFGQKLRDMRSSQRYEREFAIFAPLPSMT